MATIRDIPGFYYDPEKRKYFKIEKSGTAPAAAAWSADNVKRRKIEDEAVATRLKRETLSERRISSAAVLSVEQQPLMGGLLARELGLTQTVPRDCPAAALSRGFQRNGQIPLSSAHWSGSSNSSRVIKHMYVNGQDSKTGLCVAFATIDEMSVASTYVPRDPNGIVHRRLLAHHVTINHRVAPYHELSIPQISDIKYHESSNQVFLTSRCPGPEVLVWGMEPPTTRPDDPRPSWLLSQCGRSSRRIAIPSNSRHQDFQANTITPAPAGSRFHGIVGTNRGVVAFGPQSPDEGQGSSSYTHDSGSHHHHHQQHHHTWITPPLEGTAARGEGFHDVFAVDSQAGHPDVVLFGGRPGKLWIADTRAPWRHAEDGNYFLRAGSSIAHLRSVNEHQVLVAGLRSLMAVYDLRFARGGDRIAGSSSGSRGERHHHDRRLRRGKGAARNHNGSSRASTKTDTGGGDGGNAHTPVLEFPEYSNPAHINIGFDYDASTGLVAAAHGGDEGNYGNGTVALYSIRSGRCLRRFSSAKPAVPVGGDGGTAFGRSSMTTEPVRCLQFATFPGDIIPTMFVGERGSVAAYSFGGGDCDG